MVRSALGKVMWVGRTASMVLGLALVLALVVGLADAALGANGQAWVLGKVNQATATTQLNASVGGKAALVVANPNTAPASRALHLNVAQGKAPMAVNSDTRVRNLNADRVDGLDFSVLNTHQVIDTAGPLPKQGTFTSKGGTLIVTASGSGFRSTANTKMEGNIGMWVDVVGSNGGAGRRFGVFTNERDSHKAFVSEQFVVEDVAAGPVTVTASNAWDENYCNRDVFETRENYCTTTNGHDQFDVTVVEIPN